MTRALRLLGVAAMLVAISCHTSAPTSPAAATTSTPSVRSPQPVPPPQAAPSKATAPAPAKSALEDPKGELSRFFAALHKAENKAPDGRVLISQFGDSHTAGDGFTHRLRKRLQARFGDAGRGFLLPGKPMRHYYQRGARYGKRGKWTCERGWRGSSVGPFGLGAVRVHSKKKTASLFVGSCSNCSIGSAVDTFEIFYAKAPGGGGLDYRLDEGPWHRLTTKVAGDTSVPAYQKVKAAGRKHRLTVRPVGDGPVNLFGVVMERNQPGVVVDSLGVVGARIRHLHKLDWTVIGQHLQRRGPRLVVLQYGTNEAYRSNLSTTALEKRYVELIGRIRKSTPSASILVLGPPDVGRRALPRRVCKKWRRSRAKVVAKALAAKQEPAAPDETKAQGCRYRTPAVLEKIIAAQRRAARSTGVAFFDSLSAMGGTEMMDAFHIRSQPIAYRDRVHFTSKGAAWWADLVLDQMLGAYDRWAKKTAGTEKVASSNE